MDALGVTAPERSFRIRSRLDTRSRDPLTYWRHAAPQLRKATRLTNDVTEIAVRAPANGGKTEWGTAVGLACCMGKRELDGIPIPYWRGRVDMLELSRDYNEQKLASQQTYLRLIGDWPHKARWLGNDILASLRIRHAESTDDESTWSLIDFRSQENRHAGIGVRADIVRADEPPYEEIWHEVRKAGHAGRRALRMMTFTPIKRSEWAWISREYGDGPRGVVRRVGEYWAEVRYSLDDNTILSPARKLELRDGYKREGTLIDARVHGDYVNTEGSCPFYPEILLRMFEDSREPELIHVRVTVEATDQGETRTVARIPVEVFAKPRSGYTYYINVDPASGVDDAQHNPLGLHVYEMGTGDLCARWNGKLAPYSVGVMAAVLARQYNNAFVDIEMKDHWGVNVVRGLQSSHYGNLCYEQRELRPGVFAKEVGFDNNEEVKKIIVGQIQQWVLDYGAGVKYAACPSRTVLECLLDCELDADNKVIPPNKGGAHGEDMILKGQSLRQAVTRSSREIPALYTPPKTENQRIAAMIRGEDVDDEREPEQLTPTVERPRW